MTTTRVGVVGVTTAVALAVLLGPTSMWFAGASVLVLLGCYLYPDGALAPQSMMARAVPVASVVAVVALRPSPVLARAALTIALVFSAVASRRLQQHVFFTAAGLAVAGMTGILLAPGITVVWGLIALAALVVLHDRDADALPALAGRNRAPEASMVGRVAVAVLLVFLLAPVAAAFAPPPRSGAEAKTGAGGDLARVVGRYLPYQDTLDVTDRPDWGDLDAVMLTVDAVKPAFWRGQTFESWDGERWSTDSESFPRPVENNFVPLGMAYLEVPAGAPTERLRQRVEVKAPYLGVAVAAAAPISLRTTAAYVSPRASGAIEIPGGLGRGSIYVVESIRALATEALLRAAPNARSDDGPYSLEPYFELPDDIPARVRELALALRAGAATNYDMVQAVYDWMGANTEYTRDLPALPDGADPIEQHLFVDRKGWCEQIATSSTILLRLAGVPARLATGFTSGERGLLDNKFTVRAGDLHAWVEVWFPGVGWQPFDPTASVPLAGEYDAGVLASILRRLGAVMPWLLGLALAGLVAFAAVRAVDRFRRRRRRSWAETMVDLLERAGRRRGVPRRRSTTVAEYAAALGVGVLAHPGLEGAGRTLTTVLYGDAVVGDQARDQVEQVFREAKEQNPPARWWRRRGAGRKTVGKHGTVTPPW